MNISQGIKPLSYLKTNTDELLRQVNDTFQPVVITKNGEPVAVIQDPKSYENMRNAIGLLKCLSLAEEDIKKGRVKPQAEVFEVIENRLKDRFK